MSRVVKVGNLLIGGGNPIVIQSMTNTTTSDVEATVNQIKKLEAAGCQMVRMTINNEEAAKAIGEIKECAYDQSENRPGVPVPVPPPFRWSN